MRSASWLRTPLLWGLSCLAAACGDDEGAPACEAVVSSCAAPCNVTCGAGKEVACVGPDYGDYAIGDDQRCCICVDPSAE